MHRENHALTGRFSHVPEKAVEVEKQCPDFRLGSEQEFISERKMRLDQMVSREKEKFIYEYDFGDGWEHQIVVEKILQPESTRSYPICLTGKRACPPEDVGCVWGYDSFVEIIRDKKHPEHEAMLEWVWR